jgi:predicted secreted protein
VKRLTAWLAGALGSAAVYRVLKRQPAPLDADPVGPDPAEELKAKLAEARAAGDDRAEFEAGETPVDEVPDVDARRQSVHEQARTAIDEMTTE